MAENVILWRPRDRFQSGNGDYIGAVRRARAGDHLWVRIRRFTSAGQTEQDVSVPLKQSTYVGYRKDSPAYWYLLALRIVTRFLCLVLGFWVAAVRVYDRAAWNLLFILLSVANLITDSRTLFGNEDALQPFLTTFSFGLIILGPSRWLILGLPFRSGLLPTGIIRGSNGYCWSDAGQSCGRCYCDAVHFPADHALSNRRRHRRYSMASWHRQISLWRALLNSMT